ncbi:hypothetical protein BDV25DRAFT_142241 [Aspergillus avenaceus]|uniref:Zn(2)-C6 fungal-type domain-containing protein n=1 Tax=Aspergillus avenaceus TaxID=36643 RepID=A0A5N6TNR8_ASPAV|nr:hypothetical protein BDV25DRAFT_142241 [Aspergillus avenaceus]
MAPIPQPRRRKARTRRSKAGCRTCRARHIQCDETPGACDNCSSTGRVCDGYDTYRLPPIRKKALTVPLQLSPNRLMTCDEKRCFSYFVYHIVPMIEVVQSDLWQKLIFQMNDAEPAVYHSIIALSAVHHDMERRFAASPNHALRHSRWHQFSLEQSIRAFALLNSRHASNDPKKKEVVLLCCLLFVHTDLLRGDYENAFNHLQSGMRILNEYGNHSDLPGSLMEKALTRAFEHLGVQVISLGIIHRGIPHLESVKFSEIHNVHQAHQAMDRAMKHVLTFTNSVTTLSDEGIDLRFTHLQQFQKQLLVMLEDLQQSCKSFLRESYSHLSRKEQKAVDILAIRQLGVALLVKLVLPGQEPPPPITEFKAVWLLIEIFLEKYPERPILMVDTGINPTLTLLSLAYPDRSIRWKAIRELQLWSHCEGPWDSIILGRICEMIIRDEIGPDGTDQSFRERLATFNHEMLASVMA